MRVLALQVIVTVSELLVDSLRNALFDKENPDSRVCLPAMKISVVFESVTILEGRVERVKQDSPVGHRLLDDGKILCTLLAATIVWINTKTEVNKECFIIGLMIVGETKI